MKSLHSINLFIGVALAGLLFGCGKQKAEPPAADKTTASPSAPAPDKAKSSATPKERKKVLPAANYVGKVRLGYMAAAAIPDICEKLFCYCGCDYTDEHGTLLDCFTSIHGEDCTICNDESILALKMHKAGCSLADIQKEIDLTYMIQYPFRVDDRKNAPATPSEALLAYWKSREWKPTAEEDAFIKGNYKPVLPGHRAQAVTAGKKGGCCAGKKKTQRAPAP